MRLINTTTMQLEEFMASPPPYAILSHTWEDGEVTFQDFTNPNRTVTSTKKGFAKIKHTCRLAKQTGIAYAWVDTCCIDKTSSAELTEAINSMFAWYAASDICYAFLSDLNPPDADDVQTSHLADGLREGGRCRS
jgi:Heterokaryon incompatibility protein (HET)